MPPPANRPPDPGAQSPRVTPDELKWMLCVAARRPTLYALAAEHLTLDLFDAAEAPAVLFWKSVQAVAAGGKMPADPIEAGQLVYLQIGREAAADPNGTVFGPAVVEPLVAANGWLGLAFMSPAPSDEVERRATEVLRRFLYERMVADPMRFNMAGMDPANTLADPTALLTKYSSVVGRIAGVGVDPGADAVPTVDFRPKPPDIVPTGVAVLDEAMGGGHAGKECYLILGPTGGGKSALGVQIALEGARYQSARYLALGVSGARVQRRPWLYFTYELTRNQLQERVAAYGARISRNTLSASRPEDQAYSTAAAVKDYEREEIVNPCQPYTGETERMQALHRELGGGWFIVVDFSGEVSGCGIGGVHEIALYCAKVADRAGGVAGVVIDYAGLAVTRQRLASSKLKPGDDFELMATFGDEVRNRVAIPFDCPTWFLHQFHGDVGAMSPGARPSLSQARGGRNFGDNVDFAFGIGNIDRQKNMAALWMFKHRRVQWDGRAIVSRFDGRFGAFLPPVGRWDVDPYTRQIVERGVDNDFAWGDSPPPV